MSCFCYSICCDNGKTVLNPSGSAQSTAIHSEAAIASNVVKTSGFGKNLKGEDGILP